MGYIPSQYTPEELLVEAQKSFDSFSRLAHSDPDYPALHLAPPVGRLNDPNGLVFKDGVYHAFYQYSPVHPVRAVFWRHATSADLTHWDDDKTAIAPVEWYDKSGCYSGSGVVAPDGTMEFFYTGNVKDTQGNRESYQCLFTSTDDGESFERYSDNPLISGPAEGYTAHFRDPHVFWREGKWWAVIGAQREDLTGAVVYYTSFDRRSWEFGAEISFSDPSLTGLGYMFECPILFSLPDQVTGETLDVLMFCPQGLDADGEHFNNIFQCGYVVGRLKDSHFEVLTPFTEIDSGFEFYAPQIISNTGEEDRAVLMAWLGNADEDDQPSWAYHWIHMLTYPRYLTLSGGKIMQAPVEQLEDSLPLESIQLNSNGRIGELEGARTFRLQGTVDVAQQPVMLSFNDEQGRALQITFDRDLLIMDRDGSRYTVGGALRRRSIPAQDTHIFDILFDGSAIEAFFDDGAESFTGRIYLTGELESVIVHDALGKPVPDAVSDVKVARLSR